MNLIRKMRRDAKALSPIFAVLILIAIAVIAGIVVYMFTSGYIASLTGGGPAAQEKVAVQGASATSATTIECWASYVSGGSIIEINGAIVRDSDGTSQVGTCSAQLPTTGDLVTVDITGVTLVSQHVYVVTLTSTKGGSFDSPSFTAP